MIDYKKYPPNWKTEIVPRILKRAENKCEMCGLKNKQIVYSCKMEIQHITGSYRLKTIWFSVKNDIQRLWNWIYQNTFKEVKVVLTIAHLDHDETNWKVKDDRLMAMCQMCHLTYDGKEKIKRAIEKRKQERIFT